MDSSIETSRPGSTLTPKLPQGPKPRLAPKPFSLQKKSTIRSIQAPRTASKPTINQSDKVEATGVPRVTLTTPAQKPPLQTTPSDTKPSLEDNSKTTNVSNERPHREDTPKSNAAQVKSDPAPQTTEVPKETLNSPAQKPPQQTIPTDLKPSPVSEHVKDKPKTTNVSNESQHGEDTPKSNAAQVKSDPAPQTTEVPKETLNSPAQKPPQQTITTDLKPSPVSEHVKDKPKTTNVSNESPHREDTPKSSAAQVKSDTAPKTTDVPKETLNSPAQKPPQQTITTDLKPSPVSEHVKDKPKTTKESNESPHREDTPKSSAAQVKSDTAPKTTPPKETPKFNAVQREDPNILTNLKAPADTVTNSEQKDEKMKEDKTSVIQKSEPSGSDSPSADKPTYQWGGTRRRLSSKLTSKFESGGLPVSPQPTITVPTTYTKDKINKPVSSAPEQSQPTPEPPNRENNEEGLDCSGGGSIKRRISQLFDSASRPEVVTKKEEPEIVTGGGGVKERIKNWVVETDSEEPKPQVAPRTRSRSIDSPTSPEPKKIPKLAPVEPPAAGTPSASSEVSPVKQPTETPVEAPKDAAEKPQERTAVTPGEHEQNKSAEVEVQLCNHNQSIDQTATNQGESDSTESPRSALKRNNTKRRSVRFGIVETDDGDPPLILGSPSDSSSEEEDVPGEKSEKNIPVSVPVYRRVGSFLNKDNELQKKEEEEQKHLEFEKRLKAEESEQARLRSEEERKKKEEEEREEELRHREEEKRREEERARERLKEEEVKRERLKEEERQRQMELMQQRQREEERERMKREEEQLRKDQEEREKERQREEERKKEILRQEEIERERLRKEAEEKERERQRQEEERKRQELEKRIQQEKEEEMERMRQIEKQREEERKRQEVEKRIQQEKEEEMERMRQIEKQREEERKRQELEKRIQQEKEEEMERMRQIEKQREEERKRQELEKRIQQEKEEEM
ncbi:inner centromere protein-like, partial [Anabas testudineus]